MAQNTVKHDWYQTDTAVVVTVLLKNVTNDVLQMHYSENRLGIEVKLPDSEPINLAYNLMHKIVPEGCTHKITPFKIEVKLAKLVRARWDTLEKDLMEEAKAEAPLAYPSSKGKDWSAIEKDISDSEKQETPVGEDALNELFREIYGKGSDEVKKAMNKSFMESGGTVLSTNWNEISKDKVQVQPPDGMEFKKWQN